MANGSLDITWDAAISKIVFTVSVKDNSYIAFGWGSSMSNTDMVIWRANGASSLQQDLWATGHVTPQVDAQNAYTTTFTQANGFVNFVSKRALNGNGGANDFIAQLDVPINAVYAYHATSSTLVQHDAHTSFSFMLSSTGQSSTTSTLPSGSSS